MPSSFDLSSLYGGKKKVRKDINLPDEKRLQVVMDPTVDKGYYIGGSARDPRWEEMYARREAFDPKRRPKKRDESLPKFAPRVQVTPRRK